MMLSSLILLVDDEVPFVETMIKRLSKRKLRVEGVFSGEEALARLKKQPAVDVVILDIKMPGMDGIETLKEIKRQHPLVEVIMLTGHGTIKSGIEGMKLGAFDYLTKPAEIEELVAKVEQAAARKSEQEQRIMEAEAREISLRRGD